MPAAGKLNVDQLGTARVVKIKGTSSYTTGGYDLPDFAIARQADGMPPAGINDGAAVIALVAPGKVKFITAATGAEVANASDQSAVTVQVLVP